MYSRCSRFMILWFVLVLFLGVVAPATVPAKTQSPDEVATFSIVAYDPDTEELGVAVASRFFAVGAVVPYAKTQVGAIATQAYANTTFGPGGLWLLHQGHSPDEALDKLIEGDPRSSRRQVGIVDAKGHSATFTGDSCSAWAGGRCGPNYAVQGNILAGEEVVAEMERTFLETEGTLADRMYASLLAGEAAGGDSRGKQSAALLVVRDSAGYGGYNDIAIDIRIDDHPEPFKELGRLLKIAQMNYSWNDAWTLFTNEMYAEALPHMERTAELAPDYPEVWYDVAVIRLANEDIEGALEALEKALTLNPSLKQQAKVDGDLAGLHGNETYETLIAE